MDKFFNDEGCSTCNFTLFHPISRLNNSVLGLYSDNRFLGRSILRLNTHKEHLTELSTAELCGFMSDIQVVTQAIKNATGCERVNMAILGNAVPHLHAHLIPRYPHLEPLPHNSPWDDPRPKEQLRQQEITKLRTLIRKTLKEAI